MSRPPSDAIAPARDVLNVIVAPSSPMVLHSVLDMLRNLDRGRWYASLLIEGHDDAPDHFALGQAARGIGVPVMSVRTGRGPSSVSRGRMFFDEWFLIRNARASIIHVHSPAALDWSAPVNWVRIAMPRLPFVVSVYGGRAGDGVVARFDAGYGGLVAAVRETNGSPAEVDRLYESALTATHAD